MQILLNLWNQTHVGTNENYLSKLGRWGKTKFEKTYFISSAGLVKGPIRKAHTIGKAKLRIHFKFQSYPKQVKPKAVLGGLFLQIFIHSPSAKDCFWFC